MTATGRALAVLCMNTGSTSLKIERYELAETPPAIAAPPDPRSSRTTTLAKVENAVSTCLTEPVDIVAHRIVLMPREMGAVVRLDAAAAAAIAAASCDAPLHNEAALRVVELLGRLRPELPQYAVSDSAFHATLSEAARTYALPRELSLGGLTKIGFHGLSHEYAAHRGCAEAGLAIAGARVVTAHLGGGSSLCAVVHGESVDTTMGFTPLDGVPMATRSGSVDPGVLLHLLRSGTTVDELEDMLEHRSGLLGISSVSGDVRELLASPKASAQLAIDVFTWRVRAAIGGLIATLGGIDLLVFTGGIGEHADELRARILTGGLGVGLGAPNGGPVVRVTTAREGWQLARKAASAHRS